MVVQHNLTAMNSNRMLGLTTKTQAKSTERLSSGYKINRAADDAAGLSISEKMRKQIRGLTQASANAQDGISAVQTAEGALNEVQDMLQRMNELAVKASNGTMSENDREYVQNEIDQLVTEIDRVSTTTKFNETYLLKGDGEAGKSNGNVKAFDAKATVADNYNGLTIQKTSAGNVTDASEITLGTVGMTTSDTTLATVKDTADATKASAYSSITFGKAEVTQIAKETLYRADGTVAYNVGQTLTADDVAGIANLKYMNGGNLDAASAAKLDTITMVSATLTKENGETISVTASQTNAGAAAAGADDEKTATAGLKNKLANYGITLDNTKAGNGFGDFAGKTLALKKSLTNSTTGTNGGYDITGTYTGDLSKYNVGDKVTANVGIDDDGKVSLNKKSIRALELSLHVGADSTKDNKISVEIDSMSAEGLGVEGLKVNGKDSSNADKAIDTIAEALQQVSTQRSALGAVQNRLEHTINNLDNVVENTTSAESQIRDTDMASEMVKYSNNNILSQAGQAMLAQANQSNQGVLSLLG